MSLYINPSSMSKEEFLQRFGMELLPAELDGSVTWNLQNKSERCLISLVQNLSFSAAGIIEDENDFARWKKQTSSRPQRWFIVQTKDINRLGNVGVQL